jgi:hypothetical protein
VLLDGLDECLDYVRGIPELIAEHVEALGEERRRTLRLRMTCRTARWPKSLEEDLSRLLGRDTQVVRLAPLTVRDAEIAAQAAGVAEPAAFTAAVRERGLVALATHPVTLREMVDSFREDDGQMPATAEGAYLAACRRLCTERIERRPRDRALLNQQATPERLLQAAAWVAAAMQFGRFDAVSDHPEPDEEDLALTRLAMPWQPDTASAGRPGWTTYELRQVVESGLFLPVGELRWVFAHHSYQEFLAAHCLQIGEFHAAVQRSLLWVGAGTARHILPAHREVAAWRCIRDRLLFNELLQDDPLVLQLADLQIMSAEDRGRVVDALFRYLEREDTATLQPDGLARLDHPRLGDQLRPFLHSGSEEHLQHAAVGIARACRPGGLNEELLAIGEDSAAHLETRVAALGALVGLDTETLQRLDLLSVDAPPEVVAAALRRLWPGHVSLADFLGRVPDPEKSYFGTAYLLRREIPDELSVEALPEAVRWARRTMTEAGTQEEVRGSSILAVGITARAVRTAAGTENSSLVPLIADALLALALCQDLRDHPSSADSSAIEELGSALGTHQDARRRVVRYLLDHGSKDLLVNLDVALHPARLVPGDDALHWMTCWGDLSPEAQVRARTFVQHFAPPADTSERHQAEQARAAYPSLREATAWWDIPREESPRRRQIREEQEERRRDRTYDEALLRAAVTALPSAQPEQLGRAWWRVLNELYKTADGTPDHPQYFLAAVRKAPSAPPGTSDLARGVEQAAVHLLQHVPPMTVEDFTSDGAHSWQAIAEVTALAAAGVDNLRQLSAEQCDRWAAWTVALASTYAYSDEERLLQRQTIQVCAQRAGSALATLLTAVLDRSSDTSVGIIARNLLESPVPQAAGTLLTWAREARRTAEQWSVVLEPLALTAEDAEARAVLSAELRADPADHRPGSAGRTRWIRAARILAFSHDLTVVWSDIRRRLDDKDILEEFLRSLADISRPPGNWPPAIGRLPETDLGDLYITVLDHLSHEMAKPAQWSGFLTRKDRVQDLVHALPSLLATKETPQAAAVLRQLAARYPKIWQLRRQAASTARAAAAHHAAPLTPEDLRDLAGNARLRRITDERQLHDVVLEALQRFEKHLHSPNGPITALWNREQTAAGHHDWWPCWEEDFSDIVAAYLRQDIGEDRVVINREVQVHRPGLPGARTDIQIEAPSGAAGDDTIRVVIECKGCWNSSLHTALADQLVDDYLSAARTAGIFLVGYFDCDRWGIHHRGCPRRGHALAEIRDRLAEQARQQGERKAVVVSSITVDCRLPDPGRRWRQPAPEEHR